MLAKKRVLVAEDEPTLNDIYVETFESFGYETIGVKDGEMALDYAKRNPVDFVVTDLKMPKMDGLKLLEEIRKLNAQAPPVLIITGFIDELNAQRAKELGAVDLITKPFDFDKVILYIEEKLSQQTES
ncbi:response regulator [Halobacteriovorax sp. ZH4_bin.1]|uniref:response regulator n=1 Tax=unclassified Halobacteriovorax TaxID=2639665 RepID=UPI003710A822